MDITQNIQPGLTNSLTFTVEDQHSADHIGSGSARVLSTPSMIAFMEITSRKLLDSVVPEGFSSVGIHVDVRHLAPTRVGSQVRVTAAVKAVDGLKVSLDVNAWQGETLLGTGTHERFIINLERFLKRLPAE